MASGSPVGLTKDAGYQVGARKTVPTDAQTTWDFLLSARGRKIWLGESDSPIRESGEFFQTQRGKAKIRVYKPYSHLRITWHSLGWESPTLLQMRVIPNGSKSTVAFHLDRLRDSHQRNEMKRHWKAVLEEIAAALPA